MNSYHLIDGYWLNDKTEFKERIVTSASYDDFGDDESGIFFFDLDEEAIKKMIEEGEDTSEEFVITGYKPVKTTCREIDYHSAPYGHVGTIPKGSPAVPASNLPEGSGYWVLPWSGMSEQEESWGRNYGFLLGEEELEDCHESH